MQGSRHPHGSGEGWRLLTQGEAFRLFFPIGALLGLVGVGLWPLHIWGGLESYPGLIHARIMVEGFLTAFVIGFLATAMPRLLGVPHFRVAESVGLACGLLLLSYLHLRGATLWGDQVFFLLLASLSGLLGIRAFLFQKDLPPPSFVLVGFGLAAALTGAAFQVLTRISPAALPEWAIALSRILLYQGYLLFPLLGVGAFLLPRFFGAESRQSFEERRHPSLAWKKRALFATICGLGILGGFCLTALNWPRPGNLLVAITVTLFLAVEIPPAQLLRGEGSLATGLRFALPLLPGAYFLLALWPAHGLTLLHLLFVGGFSLLALLVSCRVILGHSVQTARFENRLWPVLAMTALIALAMLTRVSADRLPSVRLSHYGYASVAWMGGVLLWALTILPGVTQGEPEA